MFLRCADEVIAIVGRKNLILMLFENIYQELSNERIIVCNKNACSHNMFVLDHELGVQAFKAQFAVHRFS